MDGRSNKEFKFSIKLKLNNLLAEPKINLKNSVEVSYVENGDNNNIEDEILENLKKRC